jgi:hypothetical protein
MSPRHQWLFEAEDDEAADRQTASLGAVAVILALLVFSLFLVHVLQSKAVIEDCLLSGRTNCNLLVGDTPTTYPLRPH